MHWINCEDELPPCDGKYYVSNNECSEYGWGLCDTECFFVDKTRIFSGIVASK